MKLVVGLGNPGLKYEHTRHNVGFRVVDLLAEDAGIKVNKIKWKSLYGEGRLAGDKVILLKPQTFMNNSGIAVMEAVNFFKLPLEDVIVIYDDIDIPFGTIRIKPMGSSGSHNGMKSILFHLQDEAFPRVRISIGKKPSYMDLADFVLSSFAKTEEKTLERQLNAAAASVKEIIQRGVDAAMNEYNGMDFNQA
ncbi:MAG: aminoacyl-tRNA hydrolase [Tissierellia bacterium]|nr:aminoacyl-tRNA hydrolase [Tissierellia bacterium]